MDNKVINIKYNKTDTKIYVIFKVDNTIKKVVNVGISEFSIVLKLVYKFIKLNLK